ncbi:MAG TPA: efflux RND transporter periplasmic adaptor subunit, partial [Candidatus Obscuribacterales bacterium]
MMACFSGIFSPSHAHGDDGNWQSGAIGASKAELEPAGRFGDVIPLSALGREALGLTVTKVTLSALPLRVSTSGRIEAIPTREYSQHSPVAGRISEVRVNPGDSVRKGEVLMEMESPDLNKVAAEILQSKQALESEIAQQQTILDDAVKQATAQVTLARENYKRDQRLYEERIGSLKALQTSKADLEVLEVKLKSAEERRTIVLNALRTRLKLTVEPLRQRLLMLGETDRDIDEILSRNEPVTRASVRSARPGIITSLTASAGQSVDPSVKLCTVSDITRVWATAQVYEDDMARVKLGQPVTATVQALPGTQFRGVLTFIGQKVDATTRTLPVRAELQNPGLRLKPDMYADLVIETREPQQSILLPQEAVIQRSGHSLVFVTAQKGYQAARVKVGRTFGDRIEITEGLSAGEEVVTRGAFQLAAELLKAQGSHEMFASPTEGEREQQRRIHSDFEDKNRFGRGANLGLVIVAMLAAFVMGFVLNALIGKKSAIGG